jgi:hypothetical protein
MLINLKKSYDPVTVSGVTPIRFVFSGAKDFTLIGAQMVTTSTAAGTWTVEASNNLVYTGMDQVASTGTWVDATGLLNAAPTAVTTASDQYRQVANFAGYNIRFTFTPSAGAGAVSLFLTAKG